jgi:hypothetical protein
MTKADRFQTTTLQHPLAEICFMIALHFDMNQQPFFCPIFQANLYQFIGEFITLLPFKPSSQILYVLNQKTFYLL